MMSGYAGTMREASIFVCPKCDLIFEHRSGSYVCRRGHSFDRARSGYVNLHQGAVHGDTRAMLLARRAFLERGFFRPIADAINDRVVEHLHRLRDANLLCGNEVIVDAGCGEGYYLRRLADRLQQTGMHAQMRLVGIDASRDAVRLAASRLPGHPYAAVDITNGTQLQRGTAAVLLNVFAPRNPRAFAETLMPGGLCLVVIPRAEHMSELRALLPLLEVPPAKRARVVEQLQSHLTLMRCQDLDYVVQLDAEAVRAWVRMGPNAWHLQPDRISAVRFPGTIAAHIACTLMSFVRSHTRSSFRPQASPASSVRAARGYIISSCGRAQDRRHRPASAFRGPNRTDMQ